MLPDLITMDQNPPQAMNDFSPLQSLSDFQLLLSQNRRRVQDDREFRQDSYGSHTRNAQRISPLHPRDPRGIKRERDQPTDKESSMTVLSTERVLLPHGPNLIDRYLLPQPDSDKCRCVVGYRCDHKSHAPPDPRLKLPDIDRQRERAEAEAFERQRGSPPLAAVFVEETQLRKICEAIDGFCDSKSVGSRCEAVRDMRSWIIKMEYATIPDGKPQDVVRAEIIPRVRRFLEDENDVRRRKQLPPYIEEELAVLLHKWDRKDWDGNPRRGLLENRNAIDENYALKRSGQRFGANELINGQMWGNYTEMRRDGVHPTVQAGICGSREDGAYSVVMNCDGKHYADVDNGDVIQYMGTLLKDVMPTGVKATPVKAPQPVPGGSLQPTNHTKLLKTSLRTGRPVRVIRKLRLANMAAHQPDHGYRYDGLYQVTAETLVDQAQQGWSFRMERLPCQGPLRPFPVPIRKSTFG